MTELVKSKKFDLEERTAKFAEDIITFVKSLPSNHLTSSIISQLIRAGTSVGANYCEANDAESKRDFTHKIGICKKEAHETKYWLRIIGHSNPETKPVVNKLWQEAKELTLIFNTIIVNSNKNVSPNSKIKV